MPILFISLKAMELLFLDRVLGDFVRLVCYSGGSVRFSRLFKFRELLKKTVREIFFLIK